MIYMHACDGSVTKYDSMSSITHIIEYKCNYELIGVQLVKLKVPAVAYVACYSWEYVQDWLRRNDFYASVRTNSRFYPEVQQACVRLAEKEYAYWARFIITIDYTKDYHFYPINPYCE